MPQNKSELIDIMNKYLNIHKNNTISEKSQNLLGLIMPHSSWSLSEDLQGEGYSYLNPEKDQTVIILAPTHKVLSEGCAASNFDQYESAYGKVDVDRDLYSQLKYEFSLSKITKEQELQEHSVEIILPYLQHIYAQKGLNLKIFPLYCMMSDYRDREYYGDKLTSYFQNENYFFIISSDLSHFGPQYNNQKNRDKNYKTINEQVEVYDQMVMNNIQFQNSYDMQKLMKTYSWLQVCGYVGIEIILNSIQNSDNFVQIKTEFLSYKQSQQIKNPSQSVFSMSPAIIYQNPIYKHQQKQQIEL